MSEQSHSVDVSRSYTSAWLVKVPRSVAEVWRPLCEQSINTQIDDNTNHLNLGNFVREITEENGQEVENVYIELPEFEDAKRLPKRLKVHKLPMHDNGSSKLHVITYRQPTPGSHEIYEPRIEGTVTERMDLVPEFQQMGKLDPRLLEQGHTGQANGARARSVVLFENTVEENISNIARSRQLSNEARKRELDLKAKMDANRRVKLEKEPLQHLLFRLFARQSAWTAKQLQCETEQPMGWLKEVLEGSKDNPSEGIAIKEKRGPNKDKYVLKFEYRPKEERSAGLAAL